LSTAILKHLGKIFPNIKGEKIKMNNIILIEKNLPEVKDNLEHIYTRTLTDETRRAYISTIKEFFHVESINDISTDMIQSVTPYIANDWANELYKNGLSPATINKKLSSLQNFYNFLCRHTINIMKYNPFATNEGCIRFKNAIKNYSDKRALSPEEVTRVFESVEIPEDKTSVSYLLAMRDLIVLELLATTGMRRAELTPIKVGDIKPYTGKYIVNITGKGNKTRVMVIANKVKKHIDDYRYEVYNIIYR
jgi:integrase/recombinase XerC